MKALVLAGGMPQIELINQLKARGIETLLADYYPNPVAMDYADKFFQISTLDVAAIQQLAIDEKVDFLITACTDQALLTVAKVSEALGLPTYVDYQTARNVTNKAYMKKVFAENGIPTAKHAIAGRIEELDLTDWKYPLIVKPVDCNSSKGIRRVEDFATLKTAFENAAKLSRTKTAIVEEYISGKEISLDVYIENGKAMVLDYTTSEKLKFKNRFIIFRSWHPSKISDEVKKKYCEVVQKMADAFGLKNSPMMVQTLTDGKNIYIIECSARTGGGIKYLSIKRDCGVDIIAAVIDLTLGKKPHIQALPLSKGYRVTDYVYCKPGVFDHLEGFEELKSSGVIYDYYVLRGRGTAFGDITNSGDRVCGFTLEADTFDELRKKHEIVNKQVKVLSPDGEDIMYHELLDAYDESEA